MKKVLIVVLFAVLWLPGIAFAGESGLLTPEMRSANEFEGMYSGTYSGTDYGTWTVSPFLRVFS